MTVNHDLLLPHEVFHVLSRYPDRFDAAMIGDTAASAEEWWAAAPEPVLNSRPAGPSVIPLRFFGDDAEHRKQQSITVIQWSSASASRTLSAKLSRFLITVVPVDYYMASGLTGDVIYDHVVWSLSVMRTGRFPQLDPYGRPWQANSWRANAAGAPLDVRLGYKAALGEIIGDAKWLKEVMNLQHHYNKGGRICHVCKGRKDGQAPSCYDFGIDPEWLDSCDELEPAWGTNAPPVLSKLPGYTKSHITTDAMHCIHLGPLLIACGNGLRSLFEYDHFGTFTGELKVRARLFVNEAYARFRKWAKDVKLKHSQTRFSLASIGIPSGGWIQLLAKAGNCKVVTLWLAAEFSRCPKASRAELALFHGYARVLDILHGDDPKLSSDEADSLLTAGRAALQANACLCNEFAQKRAERWHLVPKHHMMHHVLLKAHASRRRPPWCFADEDFNGQVVKSSRHAHLAQFPNHVVFMWNVRLWKSTRALCDDWRNDLRRR